MSEVSGGWYPDPWTPGQYRFWTGTAWTADVRPGAAAPPDPGQRATFPAPATEAAPAATPAPDVLVGEPWQPTTTGPTGRRRRRVLLMALILAAGLVVGFVGVFTVQQLRDRPSAAASPVAPGTNPTAAALAGLVVRQADVASTVTVAQLRNGTAVSGATTLDLCNGTFPSESLRRARLQVAAYDAQGAALLSTEAVAYRSPAGTAQAFAELRSVAARCPNAPVTSPVGEPTVTTKFAAAPDRSWPRVSGVDRQAYDFTSTDASGTSSHAMAVYLKRGRVLLAVYFPQPDGAQSPAAGASTVPDIVKVFAGRLAKLPKSVTG